MSVRRLLLVSDAVGGVWTYSVELARSLRPIGIDVVLAIVGPALSPMQREQVRDFRTIETGLALEWMAASPDEIADAAESLAMLAKEEGVDLVQTSSAALLAHGDFTAPCVAVQHSCVASWWDAVKGTPLPAEFEWRRDLVQRGLDRADIVVAPSLSFAAETRRIYDCEVHAVHNGRTPPITRAIPQGQFVFTAGRLWDEGKNVATLDCAAATLDLPFQAAGPVAGPNGASVHLDYVEALGTLSATRLDGLYAARPIYASAALYEPFGLSVLEAAQAGCALVLSDIPTHREIWGEAAIFVPARDHRAFAAAIADLVRDPDERDELGALAAARAAHYLPQRTARGMANVYGALRQQQRATVLMADAR